jgi:3-hydroxyacyl-CoA dehydrogenase
MFYGDQIGLDKVLAKMRQFEGEMGAAFKPAALLEKLAAEGKRFQDAR